MGTMTLSLSLNFDQDKKSPRQNHFSSVVPRFDSQNHVNLTETGILNQNKYYSITPCIIQMRLIAITTHEEDLNLP